MNYREITIEGILPENEKLKQEGRILSNNRILYTKRGTNCDREIYTKYIFGRYRWDEYVPKEWKSLVHIGFFNTHNKNAIPTLETSGEHKAFLLKHTPIQANDMVVEIGAYQGLGSVFIADRLGTGGKALCLEPSNHDFKFLSYNIQINNINNIKCINKGLWHTDTKMRFFCDRGTQNRSLIKRATEPNALFYDIVVLPLDALLEQEGFKPTLIIMESTCQGELQILQGMQKTLKQDKLRIVASIPTYKINGRAAINVIKEFLQQRGFQVYKGATKLYALKGH